MSLARSLTVFSSALLLTACVPAPLGKYYKPVYPDASASYSGDQCGGKAVAPASLTFALADGLILNVSAWRRYGEESRVDRPLRITITVPKDVRMEFLDSDMRIGTDARGDERVIPTRIDVSAAVMMPSDALVDLQKIAPTPFFADAAPHMVSAFSASTTLNFSWRDDFVPSSIALEIPAITVADGLGLPPTKLLASARKRQESYAGQYKARTSLVYATKESEAALAQKYATCKKDTPHLKCEQILVYDDARFRFAQAGFELSGRLYVFHVEAHSPFNGELALEYKKPVKWKFASNEIRITDLDSGAIRAYGFDKFPLYVGYSVPLATPVRGVNDAPYVGATKVTINSSLGSAELPRYFVRLPPMLINGKPYQIQPIELEKRLTDFGLAPFNC